ncbi:hypothetical protein JCM10213_003525 [Rhodosporidiobolus nylandii]
MAALSEQTRSLTVLSLGEEVFDEMLQHVDEFDGGVNRKTMCAWTTTCRTFLPSGQRALYRKPVAGGFLYSVQSAIRLLRTLKSSQKLAGLVRDLSSLGMAMAVLALETSGGRSSTFNAAAWQDEVIKLAGKAKSIAMRLTSIEHAAKLGKFVALNPDVEELSFSFAGRVGEHKALRLFFEQFPKPSKVFQSVHFKLESAAGADDTVEKIPFETEWLLLDAAGLPAKGFVKYLPPSLASLTNFTLVAHQSFSAAQIVLLFERLRGNKLTTFTFSGFSAEPTLEDASEYAAQADGTVYPTLCFSTFPHAHTLNLEYGKGMSLDKLALLAVNSPNLVQLNLRGTFWLFSQKMLEASDPSSLSLAEEMLLPILSCLPALKRLRLRYLPVNVFEQPKLSLEAVCEEKGIELDWEGCRSGGRFFGGTFHKEVKIGSGAGF